MADAAERIDADGAGLPGVGRARRLPAVWRCGHAFKDDKIYVFGQRRVLVAKAWPDLRAWYRTPCRPWKHDRKWADDMVGKRLFICDAPVRFEPPLDPPDPDHEWHRSYWNRKQEEEHAAFSRFAERIPERVRTEALRYGTRVWHVLCLFARCPGALDLSASNPALAFALASNWVFRKPAVKQPMRAARSLVRKRQRFILEWLGFPSTENLRRIFAKVDPGSLSTGLLLNLRRAILHDPGPLKTFSHLPRLDADAVRLATHPHLAVFVTPSLLHEVASREQVNEDLKPFWLLRDSIRMWGQMEPDPLQRRFRSIAGLQAFHDDLARRYGQGEWANIRRSLPDRFPDPPFVGSDSIVPLLTPESLREEGIEMNHCVASYAREAAGGNLCIYRITSPVRATLAIRSAGNGRWEKQEMRGASNAAIDTVVQQALVDDLFRMKFTPEESDK